MGKKEIGLGLTILGALLGQGGRNQEVSTIASAAGAEILRQDSGSSSNLSYSQYGNSTANIPGIIGSLTQRTYTSRPLTLPAGQSEKRIAEMVKGLEDFTRQVEQDQQRQNQNNPYYQNSYDQNVSNLIFITNDVQRGPIRWEVNYNGIAPYDRNHNLLERPLSIENFAKLLDSGKLDNYALTLRSDEFQVASPFQAVVQSAERQVMSATMGLPGTIPGTSGTQTNTTLTPSAAFIKDLTDEDGIKITTQNQEQVQKFLSAVQRSGLPKINFEFTALGMKSTLTYDGTKGGFVDGQGNVEPNDVILQTITSAANSGASLRLPMNGDNNFGLQALLLNFAADKDVAPVLAVPNAANPAPGLPAAGSLTPATLSATDPAKSAFISGITSINGVALTSESRGAITDFVRMIERNKDSLNGITFQVNSILGQNLATFDASKDKFVSPGGHEFTAEDFITNLQNVSSFDAAVTFRMDPNAPNNRTPAVQEFLRNYAGNNTSVPAQLSAPGQQPTPGQASAMPATAAPAQTPAGQANAGATSIVDRIHQLVADRWAEKPEAVAIWEKLKSADLGGAGRLAQEISGMLSQYVYANGGQGPSGKGLGRYLDASGRPTNEPQYANTPNPENPISGRGLRDFLAQKLAAFSPTDITKLTEILGTSPPPHSPVATVPIVTGAPSNSSMAGQTATPVPSSPGNATQGGAATGPRGRVARDPMAEFKQQVRIFTQREAAFYNVNNQQEPAYFKDFERGIMGDASLAHLGKLWGVYSTATANYLKDPSQAETKDNAREAFFTATDELSKSNPDAFKKLQELVRNAYNASSQAPSTTPNPSTPNGHQGQFQSLVETYLHPPVNPNNDGTTAGRQAVTATTTSAPIDPRALRIAQALNREAEKAGVASHTPTINFDYMRMSNYIRDVDPSVYDKMNRLFAEYGALARDGSQSRFDMALDKTREQQNIEDLARLLQGSGKMSTFSQMREVSYYEYNASFGKFTP